MSARRPRHEEPEEHENHERWLVTYADMVTLLMVLFIVMFAMSQVDERKFNELRQGLASGFGGQESILDGAVSIQSQPGETAVAPVAPQLAAADLTDTQQAEVAQAVVRAQQLTDDRVRAEAQTELDRLQELRRELLQALADKGLRRDVTTTFDERGLVVSLVSRHIVFAADRADLSPRGREVVDVLARVLRSVDDPLEIDGHTNQVPVKPAYFDTDWDLSAARAITVLRRLNEVSGIATDRLSLAAFGHTRPIMDPSEPGSQAINKRVDIVVLSSTDPQTASWIPTLARTPGADLPAPTDTAGPAGPAGPATTPSDVGQAAGLPDPTGEQR